MNIKQLRRKLDIRVAKRDYGLEKKPDFDILKLEDVGHSMKLTF